MVTSPPTLDRRSVKPRLPPPGLLFRWQHRPDKRLIPPCAMSGGQEAVATSPTLPGPGMICTGNSPDNVPICAGLPM